MTPNLVLGPSVAVGVGFAAHYSPWVLLPVVTMASCFEGLVVACLGDSITALGFSLAFYYGFTGLALSGDLPGFWKFTYERLDLGLGLLSGMAGTRSVTGTLMFVRLF